MVPPPSVHPPPQSGEAKKHAAELKEPTAQPEANAGVKPAGAEAKPPVLPNLKPAALLSDDPLLQKGNPQGSASAVTLISPSSLAETAKFNLHIDCLRGRNSHHILEGTFKASARALRQAVELNSRIVGVPSTKGSL